MSSFVIAAFYQFADLPDYAEKRAPLEALCERHGVRGTVLLAREGVNGTIAGPRAGVEAVLAALRADARLADLEHKEAAAAAQPFGKLKVRLKREIVTLGVPGIDPARRVGTYVEPEDWNTLVADPDVLLIDTRNSFEVHVGAFEGAVNPETKSFREFPAFVRERLDPRVHRKVAMYCTGGIRCEKASAYLLAQGFEEVYHLRGGILKYLERVPEEESRWRGECFVFDGRVSVDHRLQPGRYDAFCSVCQHPISEADRTSAAYREGVSCPWCHGEGPGAA